MQNVKRVIISLPILLLFFFFNTNIAQIQSISGNGEWENTSTWIGNVIPGENDDVIINGYIIIRDHRKVRNLTINNGGTLENKGGYAPDLIVSNNLINNSLIKNNDSGWYIDLYVTGNVTNNGSFTGSYLSFNSSESQYIGGSGTYQGGEILKSPNGTIIASSNLSFGENCRVNLADDVLDMQSYKLTATSSSSKYFYSGTVKSNGQIDVTGTWGSGLDGNFTLVGNGVMQIKDHITVLGNFTVAAGKVVENLGGYAPDVYVKGNIINNGVIKSNDSGWYIDLYCEGNVTNNGTFTNTYLTFNSENNQQIGGTAYYNVGHIQKIPNGDLTASSNLLIGENCRFDLNSDVLYMLSYKLTAKSKNTDSKYFYSGTVNSNGDIDVTGPWGSSLDGDFTLTGTDTMRIREHINVYNNLIVGEGKVIENQSGYAPDVNVYGDIINYGIIRNNNSGWYIDLYAHKNVINEGVFAGSYLTFASEENQFIGGSAYYSVGRIAKDPNGTITASSNLFIDSTCSIQLYNDVLDMQNYTLKAISRGGQYIYGGTVKSEGIIDVDGVWGCSFDGSPLISGDAVMQIRDHISSSGDLTISENKIVENLSGYAPDLTVEGTFENFGTVRNNTGGWYIDWYFNGNFYNYGKFKTSYATYRSDGTNNLISGNITAGANFQKLVEENNGTFTVDGIYNNEQYLNIADGVTISVPEGNHFSYMTSWNNSGKIQNQGGLSIDYKFASWGNLPLIDELNVSIYIKDRGDVDTFTVSIYENSTYPNMSSSIKRWWSFEGNGDVAEYYMTLKYDDSILNGQDENSLRVFLTNDEGENWIQISSPVNTTQDTENNTITIGSNDIPLDVGFGDIIISSGNLALIPQIGTTITGRTNIRVGPPNYYDITYWNNSEFATDQFAMLLNTYNGVYIKGITTTDIETGEKVTLPIDSLTYSDVDDEIYLLMQPLQPNEVRSFTVNLGAHPDGALNKSTMFEPFSFTAAAIWIGGAVLTDYVGNVVVEGCYEMWRPVRHDESLTDASVTALKNSMKKAATFENGGKSIAKKAVEEIGKKTGRFVAWPAFLAMDVYDCLGNTFKGMKDYVNGNFDKKNKKLNKVTSWDPNAKEGPTGFGDGGYMASTDPMQYTIFFENKKEATAPAWKIQIYDTLDANVYDIESVKFGEMSHDMGVASREGNILYWEFVEIELPPNNTPPEGEGYVKFTVNLKPNLPTGTEIRNKATIVFDEVLKPIETNVALNTLDFDPPVSNPETISYDGDNREINLNWTVDDKSGSGQKITKVYMSKNGAPYQLAGKSETTSTKISVDADAEYTFYLLTEDNVGNIELEPSKVLTIVSLEDKDVEVIPTQYSLKQNYPNPFNPSTIISYQIPVNSLVKLKIYDILGREVVTLVNQEQKAGTYKVDFNASKISSGIYFYNISAGNFNKTMKMILIK